MPKTGMGGCKFGNGSPGSPRQNQSASGVLLKKVKVSTKAGRAPLRARDEISPVNTKWFHDRIKDKGISISRVAEEMGVDKGVLSRALRGHKKTFKPEWAVQLAEILSVDYLEVVAQSGLEVPRSSRASATLTGIANETGAIGPKRLYEGSGLVARPGEDLGADLQAVQVRAPGTPWDGWIAYYVKRRTGLSDSINKLAIVNVDGERWLGVLQHGYNPRRWNVVRLDGRPALENVMVEAATPVLWVRC